MNTFINDKENIAKLQKKLLFTILVGSFLLALLFIHPVMYFNDEWITGNQVHQLSLGSQILYNEGKYGTYENGTAFTYFEIRNNSLPYTSYLPLLAIPFLLIISLISNNLPYLIIVVWISLTLFLYLNIWGLTPITVDSFMRKKRIFLLSGIFLFFLLNLIFYNQISISTETAYNEILSVVLFHICIYSLFCGVVYQINKILFSNPIQTLFGTVVSICCTSALFWTTTMKDHLDVIFFGALLIYSILLHIHTRDSWYGVTTFTLSGIIIWIRPEYGAFVFVSLLLIYYPMTLIAKGTIKRKDLIILLISPFNVLFGSLPLFLNNYLVMGNPLKFPWQLASEYVIVNDEITTSVIQTASNVRELNHCYTIFHNFFSVFLQRMTPNGDIGSGMFSAFFYPELQKIPIFAIIPIFLLSIMLVPILIIFLKKRFFTKEYQVFVVLVSLSICTILAYVSSISALGTSLGIYPDIRYLSPIYLPLTIIGLIILMKYDFSKDFLILTMRFIGYFTIIGIITVLFVTIWLYPQYTYPNFFLWINNGTANLVFLVLVITFIVFTLSSFGVISERIRYIPLSFLIALPLIWQISQLIVINYSLHLFSEYPNLLPAVRLFFEYITGNIIG